MYHNHSKSRPTNLFVLLPIFNSQLSNNQYFKNIVTITIFAFIQNFAFQQIYILL